MSGALHGVKYELQKKEELKARRASKESKFKYQKLSANQNDISPIRDLNKSPDLDVVQKPQI
jgi:hypothetical protein